MRVVVQRVSKASITIEGDSVAAIGPGLLLLVGVAEDDGQEQAEWMACKIASLRVFAGSDGKMSRSVLDVGGEVLSVSQFTLLGDLKKGSRPSFHLAADPEKAEKLYRDFNRLLAVTGVSLKEGRFGASMAVELVNDGPVTLILER